MSALIVKNCRLVTETRVIEGASLLIEDGRIAKLAGAGQELNAPGAEVLDAQGLYAAPGFIDAHVHGGGGYDFMCGDADSVRSACRTHLMHGTTALMATVSTADNAAFLRAMDAIERASADTEQIAGIHL